MAEFHVGETISSIHKTTLVPGGREVIFYTTILGTIGILIPFVSNDDVDFFLMLEMHMRQESPSLVGRDHRAYRSAYLPVRCVVDGDLCERFNSLDVEKKRSIAESMDRTTTEIAKKLEEARVTVAF